MKLSLVRVGIQAFALAFAVSVTFAAISRAQGTNPNFQVGKEQQQDQDQQLKQRQLSQSPAPKVDPKEEAAYKAFFDAGAQDPDKRIQLGQDFLQKYPSSVYAEAVYAGIAQSYYTKQDWKNFYAESDKALAIKPDDVDLLTMVGWVIPHMISGNESDASQQLDKAEADEKHALAVMATMPKPANITDDQFATLKTAKTAEAHSGLGLVYFRRQDYDNAVKELQQATQNNPSPDPTDFFALGASLQNSGHYGDAADAFTHCSQIMGSLQAQCKQYADNAKKLAAQQK
ncbi:MAG: tetratricopeptide repeat protein [Candidatus Acidiferrales bacterium]|jgi:tetratricopeptide (TPR) repeat protein